MLSIGEFSRICKVSTKTLRYYDEIGLIKPSKINPENNYRYYSIEQLETMLFINRLKQYNFSLEEIRTIITSEEIPNKKLCLELYKKRGLGMFVKEGAVEKIRQKRQGQFYDQFIATLIEEANKLNMSKDEIIKLIERGYDNECNSN